MADQKPKQKGLFDGAVVIHAYTRAQAIADGVLVDVTDTAKEAGFRFPVALSAAVWSAVKHKDITRQRGRLWDVLFMAARAGKSIKGDSDRIEFRVAQTGRPTLELWAACGPGDDGEPVVTIMERGED